MLRRLFLDPDTAPAVAFPLLCVVQIFHKFLQIDLPVGNAVLYLDRGLWVAATAAFFWWLCWHARAPEWLINLLIGSTLVGALAFLTPVRLYAVPLLWFQQAALFIGIVYWLADDWGDPLSRWLLGITAAAHGLGFTMLFMASQILAPAEFFANPVGQYIADVAFGSVWPMALFLGLGFALWLIPAGRAWARVGRA